MRLLHYSASVLGEIIDEPEQSLHCKPNGLWVSVEGPDDWVSCDAFSDRIKRYNVCQEIILEGDASILRIASAAEMDRFTRTFCHRRPDKPTYTMYIDWPGVSETWDGIIIAPYIPERHRHDLADWYGTWDCATGCIWRARAIERIGPIEPINRTRED